MITGSIVDMNLATDIQSCHDDRQTTGRASSTTGDSACAKGQCVEASRIVLATHAR